MIQLSLFRIRAFTAGNLAGLFIAIGRGGLQFLLIIWLQGIWLPLHGYGYGAAPARAGGVFTEGQDSSDGNFCAAAGAAGTTAHNAATYLDAVIRCGAAPCPEPPAWRTRQGPTAQGVRRP
jgi:hypothetical protein